MRGKIWIPIVMLFCCCAVVRAEDRPVVRDVAAFREGNGARVEIRADRPLTYTTYLMPELTKWVIDLPGAASAAPCDQSRTMRTAPLERISIRQKEINGELLTRIGIDFKGEVTFSVTADPVDRGLLLVRITPTRALLKQEAAAPKPVPTRPVPLPPKP